MGRFEGRGEMTERPARQKLLFSLMMASLDAVNSVRLWRYYLSDGLTAVNGLFEL